MPTQGQKYQRYQVTLVAKSPLRIGAAQDPLIDVDAPVALVGGRPVIQGSTLKGVYRSQLEALLIDQYAGQLAAARPCIPADWRNLSADEKGLLPNKGGKYRGSNCGYKPRPANQREERRDRGRITDICPTCYLLGTMGLLGFVRVPYLFAEAGADPEEGYSIRYDRAIGGAAHASNRKFQLIPPGARFSGTLDVLLEDSIRRWSLGKPRPLESDTHQDTWLVGHAWPPQDVLNKLVVAPLEAVTQLGGFRSKGFGDVEIRLQPIS